MNPVSHRDPFRGLNAEQVYALLKEPNNGLPTWPDEKTQAGYTSTNGPGAVRKTRAFVEMLDEHGAFGPGWRGLDYGAGWGRIASLLLSKGTPEQLDLVDAWPHSLNLLDRGGLANRRWKVSEIVKPGEIPEGEYTLAYAFSVFTHLAERAFWPNLEALVRSLKPGGSVYFTVRHEEFLAHLDKHRYPGKLPEMQDSIELRGHWFAGNRGDLGGEAVFGDMVVSREHLEERCSRFGSLVPLGEPPGQMQHVYALTVS